MVATDTAMAVSRALKAFMTRVVIADPLQVKTDKIDTGTLTSLYAACYLLRAPLQTYHGFC